MAGLKELRTRIESVKSTKKITSAMKMVAASKYRRAELTLQKSELFQKMMINNIKKVLLELKTLEEEKNIHFVLPKMLVEPKSPKVYGLFVLSSDRGLCGGYNTMIAKTTINRIKELEKAGKTVKVFCYGKKAVSALKRFGLTQIEQIHSTVIKKHLTYEEALFFLRNVWETKMHYKLDICEIVYSDFLSGLKRTYLSKQVIPFDIKLTKEDSQINMQGNAYYDYLPDKIALLKELSSIYMRTSIFEVLINSQASEHAARMASMDNATKNAEDMIHSLTFKYNSLRQSAITTELVEIVAGAEAM
ncbi:MAG: ATP synthase F1 subunit gamma [Alphaproteobacteria bacterium]|nr:ATP synthase F1 subunit gamma [Alphaproteobacteria bacterium]